jgi:hypothetical protein
MSITLLQLRDQARELADMEENEFVSDSELNNYINFAIAELHDILISSQQDYFLSSATGSTVAGTDEYNLPTGFYKLKGVDVKINNDSWMAIKPFNFNERNRYEDVGSWTMMGISNIRYRVLGSKLKFTPIPESVMQYRIYYVPVATKLSANGDTLDDLNQYSDFVIISAAIKMMIKEESDVSSLNFEKVRILERIKSDAKDRDFGESECITDIHADNNDSILWTRG